MFVPICNHGGNSFNVGSLARKKSEFTKMAFSLLIRAWRFTLGIHLSRKTKKWPIFTTFDLDLPHLMANAVCGVQMWSLDRSYVVNAWMLPWIQVQTPWSRPPALKRPFFETRASCSHAARSVGMSVVCWSSGSQLGGGILPKSAPCDHYLTSNDSDYVQIPGASRWCCLSRGSWPRGFVVVATKYQV